MELKELLYTIIPIAQVVSFIIILTPIIICLVKRNKISKQMEEVNDNEELLKELKTKKDNLKNFIPIYVLIVIALMILVPFLVDKFGPVEHHDSIEEHMIMQNKI